jgi:hypothetical protein
VPANRRSGLAAFSDAVLVSGDGTELAARSVNEDHNYLVLNLAVEIVKGIKTPAEARRFYDATLELKAAGKTSPYTEMLLFTPGTTL